jgi:hypothetical protein
MAQRLKPRLFQRAHFKGNMTRENSGYVKILEERNQVTYIHWLSPAWFLRCSVHMANAFSITQFPSRSPTPQKRQEKNCTDKDASWTVSGTNREVYLLIELSEGVI